MLIALLLSWMMWQESSQKLNVHPYVAQSAASQAQQGGSIGYGDGTNVSVHPRIECSRPDCDDIMRSAPNDVLKAHAIDWKDCAEVAKQWEAEVKRYNANHAKDGLQIQLGCTYSNPAPRKKPIKIALTPQEAARLNALRRESNRTYSAESSYEEQLIKAHGIKKPDYGDPCWHFVGIILDEDAITVDNNTNSPGCV